MDNLVRVTVQLTQEQVDWLGERASEMTATRAYLVRTIINEQMRDHQLKSQQSVPNKVIKVEE